MKRSLFALVTTLLILGLSDYNKIEAYGYNKLNMNISYDIVGEFDVTDNTFTFTESVIIENDGKNPVDELYFHIYANIYKSLTENGEIEVTSIKNEYGKEVKFTVLDENQLINIQLDENINEGEQQKFYFECIATIPKIYDRYGKTEEEYLLCFFYPQLAVYDDYGWDLTPMSLNGDGRYSQMADYRIELTVPFEFQVACSGKLLSSIKLGNKTTYTYEADNYRDIAITLSDKYIKQEIMANNTTIIGYFNENESIELRNNILQLAKESIEYFSNIFMPYPYETLVISTVDGPKHYSMEYTGFINLQRRESFDVYCITLLIHEIAHQWFYAVVGNDEYREPWLDEGFATFVTGLCLEEVFGKESADKYFLIQKQLADMLSKNGEIVTINGNVEDYSVADFDLAVYSKGSVFLQELMDLIGKDQLIAIMKIYCNTYAFENATTDDFLEIIRANTKIDVEPLISQYMKSDILQ